MANIPKTAPRYSLADVRSLIAEADLSENQRRDMTSAINRLCEMSRCAPFSVPAEANAIRAAFRKIRPAAFGIGKKTFSNLRSLLAAALILVGVLDKMGRGVAQHHTSWGPLMRKIAHDKRLSCGLAAFSNWCSMKGISPEQVGDDLVQEFLSWLESRTLCPKPRDVVRRLPNLWNEAKDQFACWPQTTLTRLSFRPPRRRLAWHELDERFRHDVDAYLATRKGSDDAPDNSLELFDERRHPRSRPLADTTLRQHEEHLRLAASVLVQSGLAVTEITSLADLILPERFKTVLGHYYKQANGQPSAFVTCLAQTLIQVAQYHAGATPDEVCELKELAARLPVIPFDLTEKNKDLLRQLESTGARAKLLFLPGRLMHDVAEKIKTGRLPFVAAQVAIAIDIALVAPLRPHNLSQLNWDGNFSEPDGEKGRLILRVPQQKTKTKKGDLVFEIPEDVARRLRWYRRHILSRLKGDPNGDLFVTEKGRSKSQETLSQQITEAISEHVGIHMTPHQFRHFAAVLYLEDHPEDFETVRALLGHAFSKTTRVYAGSSSRRASRAYGNFLLKQRDELKLKRTNKKRSVKRSDGREGLDHASP